MLREILKQEGIRYPFQLGHAREGGEARNEPSSWSPVTLWVVVQSVLHLEQAETTDLKHQESRRKFGFV